ncbi:hypothetical protein [Alteribacillus sp. HJP-4]|uniref:hypothetical protein n=1 Tax=Alteribacillus sp. HJP-4 TaxID=2775394 RepID=UPI0035CD0084
MFKNFYEVNGILMITLKEDYSLECEQVRCSIEEALREAGSNMAIVFNHEKEHVGILEEPSEIDIEVIMSKKPYAQGGRSRKSKSINAQERSQGGMI